MYYRSICITTREGARVSKELKKRMQELNHVNWSEVVRDAIRKKVQAEEGKQLAAAVLLTERVRKKAPEGWKSEDVIREWRERRHEGNRV